MKRIASLSASLFVIAFLSALASGRISEQQVAHGESARVTIEGEGGAPGSEVTLQTVLTGGSQQLASLRMTVGYPSPLASFVRAEPHGADAQLRIETEVVKSSEPQDTALIKVVRGEEQTVVESMERAQLEMDISADSGLGDGSIVDLIFFISEEAEPETKIPLDIQAQVGRLDDGSSQMDAIETENGQIPVLESIIFGCFFYMH